MNDYDISTSKFLSNINLEKCTKEGISLCLISLITLLLSAYTLILENSNNGK